jgi:hypothetical protein
MRWFSENVTPPDRSAKYHPFTTFWAGSRKTRVTFNMQEIKQQIEDKKQDPFTSS